MSSLIRPALPRRRIIASAPALLLGAALPQSAAAQAAAWPTRPTRIVVPFAAGGATDVAARIVAQKLSDILKQPVVIENRSGAGGTAGTDFVAKSTPDGYTLIMGSLSTLVLAQGLYSRLPYDPLKDFAPVVPVALAPISLCVRRELGVSTLQEFIALLRANPDKYSYGSGGNGSIGHIAGVAFLQQTGTRAMHVPYRGSGPMINDLLAGVVDFTADVPGLLKPHIDTGAVKALAMATESRSSLLPQVPTSAEAGLPGFKAYSWLGMLAPAGTPGPVIDTLAQAIGLTLADQDIAQRLERDIGLPPMPGYTPERFATFLRTETDYWVPLVRASGARAE